MSSHLEAWTIGIEEEYQIIDPRTRSLSAGVEHLLAYVPSSFADRVHGELQRSQIEISTPICRTLAEVRAALLEARHTITTVAHKAQCWIAAAGTHPFAPWSEQQITPSDRYHVMRHRYQQLVREQVIFGCHVHVSCYDRESALRVMNRARAWLAPLLALSANSPFWLGTDTGYASYRTQIWWRWPMAGPPAHFTSVADYDDLVDSLLTTGSIDDISHLYWDIRLSKRFPTIEFRIMDVCMGVDEAVMITGLIRALVQTCYEQAVQDLPYPIISHELMRAALWRAARYGLDGDLIDVVARRSLPARDLVDALLTLLRPALEEHGEWDEISSLVQTTLYRGNGATRQREVLQRTGRIEDVVDFVVAETARAVRTIAPH